MPRLRNLRAPTKKLRAPTKKLRAPTKKLRASAKVQGWGGVSVPRRASTSVAMLAQARCRWYLAPFKLELATFALPAITFVAFFAYVAVEPGAAWVVVNAFAPVNGPNVDDELKRSIAPLWRIFGGLLAVIQLCGFTFFVTPALHGISAWRRYGWRHGFGMSRVHRSVDPGVLV